VLQDRLSECERLDRLLEAVRSGGSEALLLRGDPGVGKSALLDHLVDQASGFRVARAAGVESEMELVFAGLHQLCAPMLDRLKRLPEPQRRALSIAFGLCDGEATDRFLVGLALLTLLADVAEDQPLLCIIDDAQWLDRGSAQALGFVARRLGAESVGLVFAAVQPGRELAHVPELVVEGLPDEDARALLRTAVRGPLDARVRDRIVAESQGNPLALLELPQGLSPAELAGGFGLPDALALPGRIEESFHRRIEALPPATQRLLLVAATEPAGDPVRVWQAAGRLGIAPEAAGPAMAAGLLERGAGVRFRHPLVRSAVYRAAPPEERQRAHCALAEATDPAVDPDSRAWHRAHATSGPDEEVAAELERSAGRAQARGGLAAAAAFRERAVGLTLDPARRAERALAAADAQQQAGATGAALDLLATARAGPLDELQRARLELLGAQIAFASSRGSDVPPLLLNAAKQLEPLDVKLARETYLEAISAVIFTGRLAGGVDSLEVAKAARAAPPPTHPPRAPDLLLDGQALLITEGYAAAAPTLQRALRAFLSEDLPREEGLRWLWLACRTAMDLWDDESWYALASRQVRFAREAGALAVLPGGLTVLGGIEVFAGQLATAEALAEEANGISVAMGNPEVAYTVLMVAAWSGRETDAPRLIEAGARDAAARGEGRAIGAGEYSAAVLYNGLGRHADALAPAQRAGAHPEDRAFSSWALIELAEAATRTGRARAAADALERLVETTTPSGTDFGLGIQALARALVSDDAVAEDLYREAIDRLGRTRVAAFRARAHLLHGEWLRRRRRRLDAREQLRTAHEMFLAMGAEAFAARAARELMATGEAARKRTVEASDQLTAQEAQIARLAAGGLSNADIGARLFLSPRTVEYHMHKVFAKLAISSRHELKRVLPGEPVMPRGDGRPVS
jgi:DNA-binding CsgD family transcriptional regulator